MRLRKPCPEHNRYEAHREHQGLRLGFTCPGGEFLADDTLIIDEIELERRELDAYARGVNWRVFETNEPVTMEYEGRAGWWIPEFNSDALTVREGKR